MRTYKELCDGKVWKAIDFMITGLKAIEHIPHRGVDMGAFGYVDIEGTCYGCAATAACEAASGVVYDERSISDFEERASMSKTVPLDQNKFEEAIDVLRKGYFGTIFRYMGVKPVEPDFRLPHLQVGLWKQDIHVFETYRDQLKKLDI